YFPVFFLLHLLLVFYVPVLNTLGCSGLLLLRCSLASLHCVSAAFSSLFLFVNSCVWSSIPCSVLISSLSFRATMISMNLSSPLSLQLRPFLSRLAKTLIVPSALPIGRNPVVSMPFAFYFSR